MPVPSVRTIVPKTVRNFGRFGDTVDVPTLTDIQTRSYDRFLQLEVPPEKAAPSAAWKASCARFSPLRATTKRSRCNSCATSSANRATAPMSVANCG